MSDAFRDFPPETAAFLRGIAEHNDKEWFTENRALYDKGYVDAGRVFVEAIGPELRAISPTVLFEPKIGKSIMRVNRDIRFSKDKRASRTTSTSCSGWRAEGLDASGLLHAACRGVGLDRLGHAPFRGRHADPLSRCGG